MHHDFVDRYSRLESPAHRLPAGAKLAFAATTILSIVAIPIVHAWFFVAVSVLLFAVAAVSRIPPRFLARRILFLEPFVLVMAAMAAFQPHGGLILVSIIVKSSLSLFCVILLANTTPFAEILRVLRRIGIPSILVTTLALTYRYLFVMLDELQRLERARACRTFSPNRRHRWRLLANAAGQLFVRSSERAERIYAAMCARGWR
jgi:cobalt/nickel transport system permease protein